MELCPDFGYFPGKILKLARGGDLTHSLRFLPSRPRGAWCVTTTTRRVGQTRCVSGHGGGHRVGGAWAARDRGDPAEPPQQSPGRPGNLPWFAESLLGGPPEDGRRRRRRRDGRAARDRALPGAPGTVLSDGTDAHEAALAGASLSLSLESAEATVVHGEEHRAVLAAIRRLPARQREALMLHYYLDLTEEQTADAMQVSRGTVKSATSRAIAAVGRMLGAPDSKTRSGEDS